MDAKQRRLYERGQRVDAYMEAQAADFPAASKGHTLAADIKESLTRIAALDVARTTGTGKRQQGTAGRGGARAELRRLVASVSDTARTIALDHPEIEGLFSLAGKDGSDLTLIATARAFADAAAPFLSLFDEYDLSATFFADLRSKADDLDASMSLQNAGTGARRESRATTEGSLMALSKLIERLDTVIRNKYRNDSVKLAEWEHARRVENAPRSKADDDAPPPPPTGT